MNKDENNKISNVFWPLFSSRFVMKKFNDCDETKSNKHSNDKIQMEDWGLPVGLIDSIKASHTYKELIKEFGIQQMENQTALDMINDKIKKNKAENKQTNIEMEI